ncbi:MAG: hypothetical protein FJ319_07750 [SAR202 cluster bacterium]|nr:hypothetical protein [SAR202 cluster bacterium]
MSQPVDRKAVAAVASRLTRAATDLYGPHRALEIRPVLDDMALALWRVHADLPPSTAEPVVHWKPAVSSRQ